MNKLFTKKLAAYSAAAVAAIALGAKADAQVIYSGAQNVNLTLGGTETYNLDLDGDATNDFVIGLQTSSSAYNEAFINQLAANSWLNTASNGQNYVLNVPTNNAIGAAATNWGNDYFGYNIGWYASASFYNNHGFLGQGDQFIGLKFAIGATTHYGWVRINVSTTSNTMTIVDWAYETTADAPITAGSTGVGIKENIANQDIAVFCYNKKLVVKNLNNNLGGNIKIYNLMGQEINNVAITDTKMAIDVNGIASGIYVATIINGKNTITRKFNVK